MHFYPPLPQENQRMEGTFHELYKMAEFFPFCS